MYEHGTMIICPHCKMRWDGLGACKCGFNYPLEDVHDVFIEDETIAEYAEYQCRNCSKRKYCDDSRGLQWDGCMDCKLTQKAKKQIALEKIAKEKARYYFFSVLIPRVDEILSEVRLVQTAFHFGKKSPKAETALSLAIDALQLAKSHMS